MYSPLLLLTLLSLGVSAAPEAQDVSLESNQKNDSAGGLISSSSRALPASLLKELAVYTTVSFCEDDKIKNWSCEQCKKVPRPRFQRAFEDPKMKTKYYIATSEQERRIIVAFRSTQNEVNEKTNLDAKLVPLPFVSDKRVKVHNGFLRGEKALEPSFLKSIDQLYSMPKYREYTLTIVGHSLGGAIASIAASKISTLQTKYPFKMDLVMYGQPKTGNEAYAKWLNKRPFSQSRVVSENDIIPHFEPLDKAGFVHSQNEIWVRKNQPRYCSNQQLEDPRCSVSVPKKDLNQEDHFSYFGTKFGPGSCDSVKARRSKY